MRIFNVIVFVVLTNFVFGQNVKLDKLELYFSQHHYKKVLRNSEKLIDNPEFDFSMVPSFYKAISLIQLSHNEYWYKKNSNSIVEAQELLLAIKSSPKGMELLEAHATELAWLHSDMMSWASELKRGGNDKLFSEISKCINVVFENLEIESAIEEVEKEVEKKDLPIEKTEDNDLSVESTTISIEAKKHLGVPYKWSGDTPSGFDCSGFTSYVMNTQDIDLPRTAAEQYKSSVKVKRKNIKSGDLVFFRKNGKVNHVGIVLSTGNDSLIMIHASSSKGIIVTSVEESSYWKGKVHGFGRYK